MESVIIEKILYVDDRVDIDESNLTPIQEFYKDAKIFVTGGSGFLGHILLEKLLRSCPMSTIYVLIRSKKGKDIETRLDEMFDDVLFNRMKKLCPDFRQKIVSVEGDCELPDLGLNAQDKKMLMDEVNIIFHAAATVRFDETLKKATAINVRATRDLARMAQQMKQLKSFVQVSTAYSNCTASVIEEKVYPTPMTYQYLIEMTGSFDDYLLKQLTSHFKGDCPNTYVYTKQIAEDVVKQETGGLPAGIYRPPIVISTYKEPIAGWINNIYGPTGVLYGVGLGLIRVMYANEDCDANLLPVDMCINGLIASAWDIAGRFRKTKEENDEFDIPVYNHGSSNEKAITWGEVKELTKYGRAIPSIKSVWVSFLVMMKWHSVYLVMIFFLHTLPAVVADAVLFCKRKKMRFVKAYRKIHVFLEVIGYFGTRSFKFKSNNVDEMRDRMSKTDRDIFFCDLREIVWNDYFLTYGTGTRIYLVKDPLETLSEAKKRYRRFQWMHRILLTILGLLGIAILRLLYIQLSSFYGNVLFNLLSEIFRLS